VIEMGEQPIPSALDEAGKKQNQTTGTRDLGDLAPLVIEMGEQPIPSALDEAGKKRIRQWENEILRILYKNLTSSNPYC